MAKLVTVVGARPQFVKAATVSRAIVAWNEALRADALRELIVHTGQHYDENMSRVFFDELGVPRPVANLDVRSGSHAVQTAAMLERLEPLLVAESPEAVIIYGDTNSTLAAALAAVKLGIPVAHVEAGLRSFNRQMPEEINRILADRVSTLLFCPTDASVANLRSEGITGGVHQVGDVMYDSVLHNRELARGKSDVLPRLALEAKGYGLATIHRAENTDEPARLAGILSALRAMAMPIVLPLHPRTRHTLGEQLSEQAGNVRMIDPVPYLDMLALEDNASLILTDSGGVQKEAFFFGVPCVTLRDETEWVELVDAGWNQLAGANTEAILQAAAQARPGQSTPLYGDGTAAERIVSIIADRLA